MYTLTKERRREVCVHEAAHAVIYALGGAGIFRIAVPPEGSKEWTIEGRKGGTLADLWGVCQPSDTNAFWFLKWDDEIGCYRAHKNSWKNWLANLPQKLRPGMRRDYRAHICGMLAGPAASQIWEGEEVRLWEGDYTESDDITKAQGVSLLLPWRSEYDYLADLTERTLRHPDVWKMVLSLADELERQGDMEEFPGLLPEAIPNWPASMMAKKRTEVKIVIDPKYAAMTASGNQC